MKRSKTGEGRIRVSPTTAGILAGELDVSAWSDEELERGQRRDKHGGWVGRPPRVVPKAVHNELVKRRMSKAYDLLRTSTYDAVATLVEIAKDEDADANVRVKAAELILDRTLGKAPQHVAVDVLTGDAPAWQRMITGAIVGSLEQVMEGEREVIDAKIVEEPKRVEVERRPSARSTPRRHPNDSGNDSPRPKKRRKRPPNGR